MSYSQQHVVAEGENPASSSYFNAEMTYLYNSLNTEAAAIAAHVADTTDAHDASAISVLDSGDLLAATTVEAALAEVQGNLATHIDDTSSAHAASAISVLDTGDLLAATTVEAALAELHGDVTTLEGTLGDLAVKDTVAEADLALTDVTTADVSTTAHGLVPKAPNDAGKFLNGLGAWAAVSSETIGNQGSDDTEYTKTGDTNYTLKKTFSFTTSAACMGLLCTQSQIKASSGEAYVRFDLDDVAVDNPSTTSTSYADKIGSHLVVLAAGAHTLKVYLKISNSSNTAYVKLLKWALIGVKTA